MGKSRPSTRGFLLTEVPGSSLESPHPKPSVLATSLEEQLSRMNLGLEPGEREVDGMIRGSYEEEELDDEALEAAVRAALAPKPQVLTVAMIKQRCLPKAILECGDEAKIAQALFRLTHLYLDGLGICELDGLELFNEATHLYLQRNLLTEIKGLDFMPKLRFLCLMENKITKVSGIRHLKRLEFLDLSKNGIATVDPEELPPNVRVLRLAGNPCCDKPSLLRDLVANLPHLEQVDSVFITAEMRDKLCDEYEAALADPVRFMCDFCGKVPLRVEEGDHFHCYTCRNVDLCAKCFAVRPEGKGHTAAHEVRPYDAEAVARQQEDEERERQREEEDEDEVDTDEVVDADEVLDSLKAAAQQAAARLDSSSRAAVERSRQRQRQSANAASDSAVLAMLHSKLAALQAEKEKELEKEKQKVPGE